MNDAGDRQGGIVEAKGNPLLVPDLTRAIREARDDLNANPVPAPVEDVETDETPDDIAEEAAAEKFRRVPNRKMLRDMMHQRGAEQPLRSRTRRVVYRNRRKHAA